MTNDQIFDELDKKAAKYFSDRYGASIMESPLFSNVKKTDLDEVIFAFGKDIIMLNESCIDNYRCEPEIEYDAYFEILKEGCCGYFDSSIKTKSGNLYFYGFNYGH